MIRHRPGAIALCLATAILAGCGEAGSDAPAVETASPADTAADPAPDASATSACAEIPGLIDRVTCFADLAAEARDAALCMEATEEAVRLQCLATYAERRGDPDACREIPAPTPEHQQLRDTCLADVAPVIEDATLCSEIETPGLRDGCYLKVFRVTGEAELCDQIEDPNLKSLCTGEPVYVD